MQVTFACKNCNQNLQIRFEFITKQIMKLQWTKKQKLPFYFSSFVRNQPMNQPSAGKNQNRLGFVGGLLKMHQIHTIFHEKINELWNWCANIGTTYILV